MAIKTEDRFSARTENYKRIKTPRLRNALIYWGRISAPMISRGFAIRSAHLFFIRARKTGTLCRSLLEGFSSVIISPFAAVAQLDRVLGYEPRGRGFNSCRPHQYKKQQNQRVSATSASPFFFITPQSIWTLFGHFVARDSKISI